MSQYFVEGLAFGYMVPCSQGVGVLTQGLLLLGSSQAHPTIRIFLVKVTIAWQAVTNFVFGLCCFLKRAPLIEGLERSYTCCGFHAEPSLKCECASSCAHESGNLNVRSSRTTKQHPWEGAPAIRKLFRGISCDAALRGASFIACDEHLLRTRQLRIPKTYDRYALSIGGPEPAHF